MSTLADPIGQPTAKQHIRRSSADPAGLGLRLGQFGDICLVVAIFVIPMTSACLQEFGIAVFVACSLLMGLTWAVQQILEPAGGSRATGAEVIVLAAIGLVCLQLVKLPTSALETLAPFSRDYLSLWGTPDGRILGATPWQTISLTPSLTRSGLVLLLAYSVFFLTLVQKLRSTENIDRVIRLVAVAAAVMALVGIAQLCFGNGKFLWMFEHPTRTAFRPARGAFSNPNHFAHFLALGIGPLVWCWHESTRQNTGRVIRGSLHTRGFGLSHSTEKQKWVVGVAIGLVLLAGTLSESRGGIAAIVLAVMISLRNVRQHWKQLSRLAAPIALFVTLAVWLLGTDLLGQKLQSVWQARSLKELLKGRFSLWSALGDAVPTFRAAGAGLGSHAEIYPTWLPEDFGVRFSHAESGYLQVLVELGVPGLVLLLSGLGLILRWAWKAWRQGDAAMQARVTALTAGIFVSGLHSFVDFVWYIPGCMVITLVLAACLCRCHQLRIPADHGTTADRDRLWPQGLAWLIVLLIVPAGKLSATVAMRDAESEHDWNRYRHHAVKAGETMTYASLDSLDTRLDAIILHLENCRRIDPADYRAASDLSAMYLQRFERHQARAENRMNVREIRNTVRTAGFESNQEIAKWLNRAFGHNAADLYRALATAQKAVRGQPVRGEIYLVLAQVGFVAGLTEQEENALIEQALRLRPHKAEVLFLAGLSHVENGDIDAAADQWQVAFEKDPGIRRMIVRSLAPYISAEEFISRIQPGADGLLLMYHEYRNHGKDGDQAAVLDYYDRNFERFASDPKLSDSRFFWVKSYDLFNVAGRDKRAVFCLFNAVRHDPQNYELRKKLGLKLLEKQLTDEALQQLEWCQIRMPDDTEVTEAVERLEADSAREVHREHP